MKHDEADPYRPCPCGSGRKYKFCCRDRERRAEGEDAFSLDLPGTADDVPLSLHLSLPGDALLPDDAERSFREGERCLQAGRFAQARRHFEAVLRRAPNAVPAHNNLALCGYMTGNIEEAIRIEEGVLRSLDPANVFALGSLAQYYAVSGREADARSAADRLAQSAPADAAALYKVCEAFARLGRHADLLDAIRRAPIAPSPEIRYLSAVACANLFRFDEALGHLREAVAGKGDFQKNAVQMLRRLESRQGPGTLDGDWPYFGMADWAPTRPLPGGTGSARR